jgi:hypothetical protein
MPGKVERPIQLYQQEGLRFQRHRAGGGYIEPALYLYH